MSAYKGGKYDPWTSTGPCMISVIVKLYIRITNFISNKQNKG